METKYNILARIENISSETIESFDTLKEAIVALDELTSDDNLDSYYSDLVAVGGTVWIQDDNGNGY
jgi:hypothetical protein